MFTFTSVEAGGGGGRYCLGNLVQLGYCCTVYRLDCVSGTVLVCIGQGLSKHQRSGFHLRDERDYSFLGPPWCNRKVDPEKYV